MTEYEDYCRDLDADNASTLREFLAAHRMTLKDAAAVFLVSPQTICNWKRTGRYSDFVYRQIYESDWGQRRFNPEWPKFQMCGVGYSDEERAAMGMSSWDGNC